MARRSMVPLTAASDARLSHGDLRVLLALGGYADANGQNIWASARTLCVDARVGRSSFFRSIKRLVAFGYVTAKARYSEEGRQLTTLYELDFDIALSPSPATEPDIAPEPVSDPPVMAQGEGPTQTGREGPTKVRRGRVPSGLDGEGPTKAAHKLTSEPVTTEPKRKGRKPAPPKRGRPPAPKPAGPTPGELEVVSRIWRTFPKRVDPQHDYVRARKAIVAALRAGASAEELEEAAVAYAEDCRREGRAAKYVKGMHNFYADEYWRTFRGEPEPMVDGLTREQWIRARMDVSVFDALAHGVAEADDAPPTHGPQVDPFELMDTPT